MVSDPKKAEVVDRLVDFLTSPDPSASKGPVAKKPKAAAKKVRRGPFFFVREDVWLLLLSPH